jgi:hypothetical protein
MTITYRATGAGAYVTTGTFTPGLPSGWQAGDIHILVINYYASLSFTLTGWTKLADNVTPSNGSEHLTVVYRIAQIGDTAPAITGGTAKATAIIVGYSGAGGMDQTGTPSVNNTSTTTDTSNGITTAVNNAMCLWIGICQGTQTFSGYSGSPTPTERADYAGSAGGGIAIAEFLITTSGTATGNRTATISSSAYSIGMQISLAPPVAGGKQFQAIFID